MSTSKSEALILACSAGEPAGIGPDLIVRLAQEALPAPLLVYADRDMLLQRAGALGLSLKLNDWQGRDATHHASPGELWIKHNPLACEAEPGRLATANAGYVLDCLRDAIDDCLAGEVDALVTAPVHKGVINDAGIPFSGHTEFLAERTGSEQVVMLLASKHMKVALATTHLPLRAVADAITDSLLEQVIRVIDRDMADFFTDAAPRIAVCGLNPHAGESGHLGREEIDTIIPCLEKLREEGIQLQGPLPADTLFVDRILKDTDVVLAMYHDQGLPVLKHGGFGEAVNITLGLPIVRTSVDHGTALDLAGSDRADLGSLRAAIHRAAEMAQHRRKIHHG